MTKTRGTALHLACEQGHIEVVRILLEARAVCVLEDPAGKIPLELTTDQLILEIIPIYMGKWELEKYNYVNPPHEFEGEVWLSEVFSLSDKLTFCSINIHKGTLVIYPMNNNHIQDFSSPYMVIPLFSIQKVSLKLSTLSFSGRPVNPFEIIYKGEIKKLYTHDINLSSKWVKALEESILYCQINKVGIDLEPPDEYELDENEFMENEATERRITDVNIESFQIEQELGWGSYGTVHKVVLKDTLEVFAMKLLSKSFLKKNNQLKYAISECRIMKQLSHPFVLTMYYAFQTSSYLYLVLEYCPMGDLEVLVDQHGVEEKVVRFYIAETLLALEYLHSLNIMYRDLKPANILLDAKGHAKLADFGLAKEKIENVDIQATLVGSPAYISPEILRKHDVTKKADLYSLGVVMYELLTGELPYRSQDIEELFKQIRGGRFIPFPKHVSKEAGELIRKLLNVNPVKRPSISEIKADQFFNKINWEMLLNKRYKPPISSDQVRRTMERRTLALSGDFEEDEEL